MNTHSRCLWHRLSITTFAGIIFACVLLLSSGCSMEPTAAGTVAEPGQDGGSLNSDERTAYRFIRKHAPKLDQIFSQQNEAVIHMSNLEFDAALPHVKNYVSHWNKISTEWAAFPAAGGKTRGLEVSFENAANDLRTINMGLGRVLDGGTAGKALAGVKSYGKHKAILDDKLATFAQTY